MEDLVIKYVNLELEENQKRHTTEAFGNRALVLRRGQPFKVSLRLGGRGYDPDRHRLIFKILLGPLYVQLAVKQSKPPVRPTWAAYHDYTDTSATDTQELKIWLSTPASAPVGIYQLQLYVLSRYYYKLYKVGKFTLLCNPWSEDDSVYLPLESQREEYIQNDYGLLYMGTPNNIVSRPWSFDQYEPDVLEICMKLLQVSLKHQQDPTADYLNRGDPVYISRVLSAMINSNDDLGVLLGKWSGSYKDGVHPTEWTGSGDVLKQWAESNFKPVKYGQCWVFAAVMCTVMRALGIPCRVVTNFNSAHDTNANLVIEEYYSIMGEKLPQSKDSIWNFHVWVEAWMRRLDIDQGFDGWQVLDPTPQERSAGIFRCGPAPVRAVRDRQLSMVYDIPFVYAEMNAEVHMFIVKDNQSYKVDVDSDRVGALICTKALGSSSAEDITATYKTPKAPEPSMRFRSSAFPAQPMAYDMGVKQGLKVSLTLHPVPMAGDDIRFTVTMVNPGPAVRRLSEFVNAQVKEYSNSPGDTFWKEHKFIQIGPHQTLEVSHQIPHEICEVLIGEDLVNLAVVVEDEVTQERALAYEEFNIASPEILIQVPDEITPHKEHQAKVIFTNPFREPIGGLLTVTGAGLLEAKIQMRIALQPGQTLEKFITFTPRRAGHKMLQAAVLLSNMPTIIRGFKTITVKAISTQ